MEIPGSRKTRALQVKEFHQLWSVAQICLWELLQVYSYQRITPIHGLKKARVCLFIRNGSLWVEMVPPSWPAQGTIQTMEFICQQITALHGHRQSQDLE